ncbi:hypothetical protein Nepgr_015860 [Nepenthes gracilis]|uniref:Uncharacterized protein n=1 Tax=Nepenthes gracilis TaxID=150966 RepID=A0AAD3SNP7_NEPGR|nr:hypothetical protein Nepgr_015860 [Nepenthes gracilis]
MTLQVDDPNDPLDSLDLVPSVHPMGAGPIFPPTHDFSSLDKSFGEIPNGLPLSSCLDEGGMTSSASDPSLSPKSKTSSPKSLRPAPCPDITVKQCPPPIPESMKVASPRAKSNEHQAPAGRVLMFEAVACICSKCFVCLLRHIDVTEGRGAIGGCGGLGYR